METKTPQDKLLIQEIKKQLNTAKNVSKILGTLFMSMEGLMARYHYTKDEALEAKENAENYLRKFGAPTLDLMTKEIEETINQYELKTNKMPF